MKLTLSSGLETGPTVSCSSWITVLFFPRAGCGVQEAQGAPERLHSEIHRQESSVSFPQTLACIVTVDLGGSKHELGLHGQTSRCLHLHFEFRGPGELSVHFQKCPHYPKCNCSPEKKVDSMMWNEMENSWLITTLNTHSEWLKRESGSSIRPWRDPSIRMPIFGSHCSRNKSTQRLPHPIVLHFSFSIFWVWFFFFFFHFSSHYI